MMEKEVKRQTALLLNHWQEGPMRRYQFQIYDLNQNIFSSWFSFFGEIQDYREDSKSLSREI